MNAEGVLWRKLMMVASLFKRWYDCDEGRMYVDVKLVEENEYDKQGRLTFKKVYNDFSPFKIWQGWLKEYLTKVYHLTPMNNCGTINLNGNAINAKTPSVFC